MTNEQITWVLANLRLLVAQPERPIERSLLADAAGVIEAMLAERQTEQSVLVEALKFYADSEHFILVNEDAWDTVSGEPLNFLHHDDGFGESEGCVEDGSIARAALASYRAAQPAKFRLDDRVRKTGRSAWQGIVVGTYRSSITAEGYAVESEAHPGAVQIYPAEWLELVGDEG